MKLEQKKFTIKDLHNLPRCYSEIIIYIKYDNDKHKVSEALGGRYISKMKKEELIEFIAVNKLI